MYLILVGGGNVGIQLAKRLIAGGHEVLIVDKDAATSRKLANLLGDEYVMQGDGCELSVQRDAGFNRADVVVAVTGEDEDNFVACQLSKEVWHVERVLARVNDPSHEETFREIGIDETVSATGIIYNLIVQQIATDELVPVAALHRGNVEIVESVITSRSPAIHKTVGEIQLPDGSFIAYLVRDGVGLQVGKDTVLEPDDMVVALVRTDDAEKMRDAICGKS